VSSHDQVHVLGYQTGTYGKNWYDSSFKSQAQKICASGYEVVEKSESPRELKQCGNLTDSYDYYWVIKCVK
jgi:hypothetical protein